MRLLSLFITLAFSISIAPVGAAEVVVNDLTSTALIGPIASTQQLQNTFSQRGTLLASASHRIGLTPQQYAHVRQVVASGNARYVELPRHIDAMSGWHGGHTFAVRDIKIPAGVYGWEVTLNEPADTLLVYIPNRCGNISYVRVRHARVLAAAPMHRAPAAVAPPIIAAAPESLATAPPMATETPAPALPTLTAYNAPVVQAATHHFAILPWLIGGLITAALLSGSHGSNGGTPPTVTAAVPTPMPLHTVCPVPAIH